MTSPVTRAQANRAPLECDGMGDLHHGCVANKSAATALYGPKALRNVYKILLSLCYEESR